MKIAFYLSAYEKHVHFYVSREQICVVSLCTRNSCEKGTDICCSTNVHQGGRCRLLLTKLRRIFVHFRTHFNYICIVHM